MSKEYYKNGSYFEGIYRKGVREGKGKLVLHNEMYEGFFKDGHRYGQGITVQKGKRENAVSDKFN